MPQFEVFPDCEAICGYALREAGIQDLDERVYSSIPNTPTFPLITLHRIPSSPAEKHHLDRAHIQCDIWGENKGQAQDIAQEARVVLHEMEGQMFLTSEGAPVQAFVTAVEDLLGIGWMPDKLTSRDRYMFTVQVYLTNGGDDGS